ncbi:MAG: GNAT family N-acetyltransferase [Steroidobacteraceae bacterium]
MVGFWPTIQARDPVPTSNLFTCGKLGVCELELADMPLLQRFFDGSPEYFRFAYDRDPRMVEALYELQDKLPAGMVSRRKWLLGLMDDNGQLQAMSTVWSGFMKDDVWMISLFVVATALHGSGVAGSFYASLENWMHVSGAQWVRLGVIKNNHRAERFWEKSGYTEVRQRVDTSLSSNNNVVRVMVKSLAGRPLTEYLQLMERDRPE